MMRLLVVALALVSVGLDALPTCPSDACTNPPKNLPEKIACYMCPISFITVEQSQKFMGMVATTICNGGNMTNITNNFMSMGQKCLGAGGYAAAMTGYSCYKSGCEEKTCNSSIGIQMSKIGKQFNIVLQPMVEAAAKVLAPYKGKCTDAGVYPAFAGYACKQGTAQLIQKLITALKGAQGPNCWPVAPKCLSPKLLLLNKYTC